MLKTQDIKVIWAELEMTKAAPAARTGISSGPRTKQLPMLAQRTAGKLRRTTIKVQAQQTKARAGSWGDKDGAWEEVEAPFLEHRHGRPGLASARPASAALRAQLPGQDRRTPARSDPRA
ncbi:hypothetical protein SBADM41S_00964 [Streptomyces badius]